MASSALALAVSSTAQTDGGAPDARLFFQAAARDDKTAKAAIDALARGWRDGYSGMVVDVARFLPSARRRADPGLSERGPGAELPLADDQPEGARGRGSDGFPAAAAAPRPSHPARARLVRLLERQTGQRFGDDLRAWRRWIWNRPYEPHPELVFFKAALYSNVDPRMASFFAPGSRSVIRLDEIDWGGVKVNGIPPLDHPRRVPAAAARYLKDDNVVFGLVLNGQAHAYPKRILAWHEMALDNLGGTEIAVVFCTLCGTVIPYGAEAGGRRFTFGTSGLLYRSNKLMFDHESSSLWSTAEGIPVVGPLAGSGLALTAFPVVTTTWREWRAAHPDTTTLALDTGFDRDYSEGAAYRDYFSTDALMFEVPRTDGRLKNKAEVLTLLFHAAGERKPLALSVDFLKRHRLHQIDHAGHSLVIVTSPHGANRVYRREGVRFVRLDQAGRLQDDRGAWWRLSEEALEPEAGGRRLPRIPARRAFWFGWHAQFPETELIR